MPASDTSPQKAELPRYLLPASIGLFGVSLALFIAALAFAERQPKVEGGDATRISVTEKLCDPMELSVPAGRHTFIIHNAAATRPLEWEILDGVMVVAERENIAPGFSTEMTTRLSPGEYQITCGLLSSPRGKLIVTETAQSSAEKKQPPVRALIGPLSEYKVQMMMSAGKLEKTAVALSDALKAGDTAKAQALYSEARGYWRRVEPVAGRMSDLAERIDPAAVYLDKGEDDPEFSGFHKLEAALWGNRRDALTTTEALVQDTGALNDRIKKLDPAPADIAGLAAAFAQHLGEAVVPQGESPHNGQDSAELAAATDGLRKSAMLLKPLLDAGHPDLATALEGTYADLSAKIGALPADYREADEASRKALSADFGKLAGLLRQANQDMGLEN